MTRNQQQHATPTGFWTGLERAASRSGDLWRGLTQHLDEQSPLVRLRLWMMLAARTDPADYRPQALPEIVAEAVIEDGEPLTIIRSPRGAYRRLTPLLRDVWQLMDGTRTIGQIAAPILMQHRQLPPPDFINELHADGFLVDQPVGVYRQLGQQLQNQTAEGFGQQVLRFLTGQRWVIPGLDQAYARLYRFGGFALFTPLFGGLWAIVALLGLLAFLVLLFTPDQRELFASATIAADLLWLWLALLVSFLLHESAHALAVKHFQRTIHSGGAMLYFGAPAFFIDTSDIWRSPRNARILVSAAGPMADLLVGGLAALLVWFMPDGPLSVVAYKLAFTCYIATLFNLNPLLELDGYHILTDLLRLPDLRAKSLAFVRGPLWQKLRDAPAWQTVTALPRAERIYTIYGILTLLYTLVAINFAWQFWQRHLLGTIERLWNGTSWIGHVVAGLLVLLIVVPVLVGLVLAGYSAGRAWLTWALKRGYGRRPGLLALLAGVFAGGLALVALQTTLWVGYGLTLVLWAVALGGLWALRPDYRGAAFAPALAALQLSTALAMIGTVAQGFISRSSLWTVADGLAFICILAAGFAVLRDLNLREAPGSDLTITALMVVLAFGAGGVALYAVQSAWPLSTPFFQIAAAAPAYFGALGLALLVPYVRSLQDSRLFWPWVLLWLAILAETAAYIFELGQVALGRPWTPWPDTLAAGLWAAAWLIHLTTLRQITPDELHWQHVPSTNEPQRLARALRFAYAGCYRMLRAVYGARRTKELDDRMDIYAATANWDVTLDREQVRIGAAVARQPLDQQGRVFAEVMRYTVATIEELAGSAFAIRAVRAAYDALPWPERETASRLLFPDTPWAGVLSSAFGDVRTARLRMLRQIDQFLEFDDQALEQLLQSLEEQQLKPGAVVLEADAHPEAVWVIEAGEVVATSAQGEQELHRGALFGWSELMTEQPSAATYRVSVPSTLLGIPASALHELSQTIQPDHSQSERRTWLRLLERISLFNSVPRSTLRELLAAATIEQYQPRDIIIREGRRSGKLFVIRRGVAVVLARPPLNGTGELGKVKVVAELSGGEFFGEIELISNAPPMATVMAATELTVLALPHDVVRVHLLGDGAVAKGLQQVGTGRLLAIRATEV
jgi:putative peptide zinc metalloprotease protein